MFFALAVEDIRAACDLLRPGVRADGRASTAGSRSRSTPTLAYDREATFAQAIRLHDEVERPNLYVKIPATVPGLGAIEDCIAQGRSINVTLIFSLERYAAVLEAYVRGLERLVAAGGDPRDVSSVASFFVSRVDTEADRRLAEAGRSDLAGAARRREREARVRALAGGLLGRALGRARREGRPPAALPVGLDLDEEPGLPRRPLRRGARSGRRR